jgi:undecaprenyl-diphosphatase
MSLLQSIILGIVQGLTEFLPISSTAHLTLAGKYMGLIDPQNPEVWTAYIAIIQLGTLIAVLIYFSRDILEMISALLHDVKNPGPDKWSVHSKLAFNIVAGSIPVAIVGLGLKKIIEGALTKSLIVIGMSMVGLALVLYIAERVSKKTRPLESTTWKDAVVVGLCQCLALIPGSSRSGTTITGGLFLGLTREAAARFSFLLSIPAVLGSGLLEAWEARHMAGQLSTTNVLAAIVAAMIVGYLSIAFLLKYLKTHTTFLFIWYRVLLGVVLLVLVFNGIN